MSLFENFPRGIPGRSNKGALLGTASWSASAPLWRPGMILLGLDDQGREAGYIDDRHMVTVAGSRGGKGVSMILPNLRRWPGSCVVLDPKGENATITAATRAAIPGHKVVVLDPHGTAKITDALRGSFNPLDLIDANDDDAIDLAAAIGDAVMIGSGDGKDIHWTESARQIFEAVLLYVAATESGMRRSLVRVRQFLIKGDTEQAAYLNELESSMHDRADARQYSSFDALWYMMAKFEGENEAVADVIVGAANSIMDMGDNERGSVLSTARRNTAFLSSTWMRRSLQGGQYQSLDIDALKDAPGGLTIYLCLPARFIATHARFLRLILNLLLFRMEAQGLDQPKCGHPCLFVLDEFAAIGRMDAIEKAAGLMAGYGVKLWSILQDLGQLKRHYKESWETFLANAGMLQFFANSDMTTLEWISKRLGQCEVVRETAGASETTNTGTSKSQSRSEQNGWTRSTGTTEGIQQMADLSRIATQDGGSGLVPFLSRANANSTSQSEGHSFQEGMSGGETIQNGDSVSSGTSATDTRNDGIHLTPLLSANEAAYLFERGSNRELIFIDAQPILLQRPKIGQEK